MSKESLQISDLPRLVAAYRKTRRLPLRPAADECGVSFNTLARVEKGHIPDFETFTRIAEWIGRSPAEFFGEGGAKPTHTPDVIEAHLRGDPSLTEDAIDVIAGMVRQFYARLSEPQDVTACHLRAAATLKPEAASILAELLVEMRDNLVAGE